MCAGTATWIAGPRSARVTCSRCLRYYPRPRGPDLLCRPPRAGTFVPIAFDKVGHFHWFKCGSGEGWKCLSWVWCSRGEPQGGRQSVGCNLNTLNGREPTRTKFGAGWAARRPLGRDGRLGGPPGAGWAARRAGSQSAEVRLRLVGLLSLCASSARSSAPPACPER